MVRRPLSYITAGYIALAGIWTLHLALPGSGPVHMLALLWTIIP